MTRQRVLGRFDAPFPATEMLDPLVRAALEEDAAFDDRASASVPADAHAVGRVLAREPGLMAGERVFRRVEHNGLADGQSFAAGDIVRTIEGPATALLSGERTALNFLQRLCGIATRTKALVERSAGRIAITIRARRRRDCGRSRSTPSSSAGE